MKRTILLWTIAVVITIASAIYQRMTGPTYPFKVKTELNGKKISFSLDRTHGGDGNHLVLIPTNDELIRGTLEWKRYKTNDVFEVVPMNYSNGNLSAELPHQPPAGKLEYKVTLTDGKKTLTDGTVIRFKGAVPDAVLLVHIVLMFTGMLLSTRAGFEIFMHHPNYRRITDLTFIVLTLGGMIMGPIVLHYAFNEWWTGFPFGADITDNKTLVAFLVWLIAAIVVRKSEKPAKWIVIASIITLCVFLVPHSLWGTELNYQTMQTN
jgi:hypothetical protein